VDVPAADFPFRFRCRRSGNCCARPDGAVRVGARDVARLAAHLGIGEAAFRSRFVAASGEHLVDAPGGRCIFLEDGSVTRCTVHPARPERCRSWPYWDEHRNPRLLAEAARVCPGITLTARDADRDTDQRRKSR